MAYRKKIDDSTGAVLYMRAADPAGTIWSTSVVDPGGGTKFNSDMSLAQCDGFPGVAYEDFDDTRFAAYSAADFSWHGFQANNFYETRISLALINGKPALLSFSFTGFAMQYVAALDSAGTTWAAPLTIGAVGATGGVSGLLEIGGRPAAAYTNWFTGQIEYLRANDADGTSWPASPVSLDYGASSQRIGFAVIGAKPAVSFVGLLYQQAQDVEGTAWFAAQLVDRFANGTGIQSSLAEINGQPAIAYYEPNSGDLRYAVHF